jgi:hypothetical protein
MPTTTKRAVTRTTAAPADPDLVPIDSEVEIWRNTTAGMTFVTRIGEYGKNETELVYSGRTFSLTPAERRLNQHRSASRDLDLFTNGTFQPVSLVDGEPDNERLTQNPNTFSDEDIQDLLVLRGEAFQERINAVTSQAVLSRILDLAREPRYEATLAQYEALKLRQMALRGELDDAPTDTSGNGELPKPVTPR